MIAFYKPNGGTCEVSAVVFDTSPNGGGEQSARVRVRLHPGEIFNLDDVADRSVMLTCGPNAKMLTVLNRGDSRRNLQRLSNDCHFCAGRSAGRCASAARLFMAASSALSVSRSFL